MTQKTQKIYTAILVLLLGSLACMQSLPSSPAAHPPAKREAQAAQPIAQAITESECKVNAAEALNVRACPGIDCSVIGWLANGQTVKAEASASGWIYIKSGQLKGFAHSKYLTCNGVYQ